MRYSSEHAAAQGVLPYKRLIGMCHWVGSHFHDWIDYNGIFNSYEDGVAHSRDFGVRKIFIFTVSKRTRMFLLQVKSKVASFNLKNGSIHFMMTYLKD